MAALCLSGGELCMRREMPSVTQHKYEVRRFSSRKERLGKDWGSLGGRSNGNYLHEWAGRNASGQGHSTVNFPVRNEGGRCVRLLILYGVSVVNV
jgi:hypothetical protein